MASLYNYYVPATPAFSASPIWKLGRKYEQEVKEEHGVSTTSFTRFLESYNQTLWFSYRKDFPVIADSLFTSDAGWGCMLRSGQAMLAQALLNHKLGRDWDIPKGENPPATVYEIVKLFGDNTTPGHPFSIHEIASVGRKYGKAIGEWFAPTVIALTLLELVNLHKPEGLKLIVSEDGALYQDKITDACSHHHHKGGETHWHGSAIMIPLRLGLDSMNSVYYQPILELFQFPQSLGIVGGKPRASLYFIAAQDDYVFFLDPHVVQTTVNTDEDFSLDSFHTTCTRKMHVSEIDPSLVLTFYCKDKADFDDFVQRVNALTEKYKDATLFTILSKAPDYHASLSSSRSIGEDDDAEEIEDMVVL